MKLNLEIELDWVDEESNLDETVKQNVIDAVVNKIQTNVEKQVSGKINDIIDKTIIDKINLMTESIFNDFMNKEVQLTDSYGSKIKSYPDVTAVIKERFDNFMNEQVDKDNGKSNPGSYTARTPRLQYIIDEQLKKFANDFTTSAVKQVSEEIRKHVSDGLTTKLGAELMKVLKVDKMLSIPQKN